ncbi:MAG: hypothetical protein QM762_03040 [Chryseolinea sp.]
MNKFSTFDEVVAERKRLQADLNKQKGYLRSHFVEIREKLIPITKVLSFFARFGHNGQGTPAGNLLKAGSNLGIDLLVGQKLKKASWLAKLVLPLVMKFTAHKTIDAVRR